MSDINRPGLPMIKSEYRVIDRCIILASSFIARHDINPTEIYQILGLTDDLQRVRKSRRHREHGTSPEV